MIAGLIACYLFATVVGGPIHSLIDRDVTNEFGIVLFDTFHKTPNPRPRQNRVSLVPVDRDPYELWIGIRL